MNKSLELNFWPIQYDTGTMSGSVSKTKHDLTQIRKSCFYEISFCIRIYCDYIDFCKFIFHKIVY